MDDETSGTSGPEVPEISLAEGPATPALARRRRRLRVALAVGTAAALVGGVVAVQALDGGDVDPEAALRRAGAALTEADSYRLTVTSEDRTGLRALDGAGTHTVVRVVDTVEVSGDDWNVHSDGGDWVDEAKLVGGKLYTRWGDNYTPIEDEPWAIEPVPEAGEVDQADALTEMLEWFTADIEAMTEDLPGDLPEDDGIVDEMVVSMLGPLYLAGLGDAGFGIGAGGPGLLGADPRALANALSALEDAEVVSQSAGRVTIRAMRRAPAEVVQALDRPVPDGHFEVVLDTTDDRPVSLTLAVENDSASHTSRINFSDWGAAIHIAAPAESEIDPTPWLDEEAIAKARVGITPLRPTVLPDGIELQDIYPVSTEEAREFGEGCAQLNLIYGPPLDPELLDDPDSLAVFEEGDDYLDIYLMQASCAQEANDTPFASGRYGDLLVRDAEGLLEVLVGDTVVQIDTSHQGETLAALVTSIQPFDLDAEIARLSALAEEMWHDPEAATRSRIAVAGPWIMAGH